MEQSLPLTDTRANLTPTPVRLILTILLSLGVGVLLLMVGIQYRGAENDAPLFAESTLAQLGTWMADQSEEDVPPSFLGQLAKQWTLSSDQEPATVVLAGMKALVFAGCVLAALSIGAGLVGLITSAWWGRWALLGGLIGLDGLLFLIPVIEGDSTVTLILLGIVAMTAALMIAPGRPSKVIGFVIIISLLLVGWETVKALAQSINYQVVTPQPAFTYNVYDSLDVALTALDEGVIKAVVADEKDLEDLMPSYPRDKDATGTRPYPSLRYLSRLQLQEQMYIFPLIPNMPGRLTIAVHGDDAPDITRPSQLLESQIGVVEGSFALDKYLNLPRQLVLLDLQIVNNLNLPHLQSIASAFLQPARRNGEFLLVRILGEAGLFTLKEAVFGFAMGTVLGLLLGILFAHSKLLERALLPYVVGSQTIPILAIAPMVVIWLGASFTSVAVIATYITFFPVAINTLRGLQSPNPIAIELMDSYAASWWTKLWKLRFPAAVPYIFAALKVSATASVVGAIIGELPSGMGDGLGRAILDFSSDYSLISTPKLWSAIITAAFIGVLFFIVVTLVERVALRRYVRGV